MAAAVKPHNGRLTIAGAPRRKSLCDWLNLVKGARGEPAGFTNPNAPTRHQCQQALEHVYKSGFRTVEKAAMAESQGLTGGYLLPVEYSNAMLKALVERSFIFPRATKLQMTSEEMLVPRVDVEKLQSLGVNALFGGLQFNWGREVAAVETEPVFKMDVMNAWDLIGYAVVSNQWLEDSGSPGRIHEGAKRGAEEPSIAADSSDAFLIKIFGKAAAWYAEYAFLNGDGIQKPLGILNSPAAIGATRAGAGTIAVADVVGMTSSLLPYSWENAIWACSPTALAKVQLLAQYFINIELGSMHDGKPRPVGVLSTLPLFVTDKLPPLGVRGDIVLFDPSLYIIGMRQEVIVDVSAHDAFKNQQTTYRIWLRCDAKTLLSGTIRLQDASTKVSPYVVLNS